ncbi:MAG: flippase-like domain-containing protein [Deltaproteobacteria bacterium]|nr:MAG: flippase-like domain-containing protein [Deltaproteobacteria bacterium]
MSFHISDIYPRPFHGPAFLAPFFILILVCFSVTIPSAPGYIGTFHLACQYGLIFYGFSKERALSMAIVLHAAGFIPTIILGLILFLLQHISLRNFTSA